MGPFKRVHQVISKQFPIQFDTHSIVDKTKLILAVQNRITDILNIKFSSSFFRYEITQSCRQLVALQVAVCLGIYVRLMIFLKFHHGKLFMTMFHFNKSETESTASAFCLALVSMLSDQVTW